LTGLGAASHRAAEFLLARQDADGGWRDFNLYKGVATSWTTAYVASSLTGAVDLDDRIPAATEAAARFLRHHREPVGGWAYNARCTADADTTAIALNFLAERMPASNLKDVAVLASFQRADGGFATYGHLPATHPWAASHAEVTATALRALARYLAADHAILLAGREWLARQATNPEAAVYWWTTPAYLGLELARLGLPMGDGVATPCADSGPFASALDLERSILSGAGRAATAAAAEALIGRQLADGSWPSAPILLVPDPAARVGSAAARAGPANADQRQTFTTATVLSALNAVRAAVDPKQPETVADSFRSE
jgi:hypothetical protein